MLKIFFSVNHSGCAWWRARQPARMLEKLGLADVKVFSNADTNKDDLEKILKWSDVIVTQSPSGIQSVALAVSYQEMGKVVIADYDDLVYSCSPFNPGYKTLGLRDVKVKNADGTEMWIWKDGEKGFSIKDNTFRYKAQIDLLGVVDGLTVTNDYLLEKYLENMPEGSSEKSFVLPNSIDFDLFKPFPRQENKKVRIGWTASSSHFNEIWIVDRLMTSIYEKYGDKVEFVVLGDIEDLKKKWKDRLEYHQFVDLSVYPLKFASLELDIGICPLVNDEFNNYKSALKWSEFASMRVPSVCSKNLAYECVEDGVTGLIAKDDKEFFEKVSLLIDDKVLRKNIADNAFEKNYRDFNLKTNAKLWVDAYQSCYDRVWKHR